MIALAQEQKMRQFNQQHAQEIILIIYIMYLPTLKIVYLNGDVALGDLPHVESDSRNHVLSELSTLQQNLAIA
jgi:hypothetical protein